MTRRHTDTAAMRGSDCVRNSVVKPCSSTTGTGSWSSSTSSQVTAPVCCSAVTIRKHKARTRPSLGQTCEQNQTRRRKASVPTSSNNETNRAKMERKRQNYSFSRWSLSLNTFFNSFSSLHNVRFYIINRIYINVKHLSGNDAYFIFIAKYDSVEHRHWRPLGAETPASPTLISITRWFPSFIWTTTGRLLWKGRNKN